MKKLIVLLFLCWQGIAFAQQSVPSSFTYYSFYSVACRSGTVDSASYSSHSAYVSYVKGLCDGGTAPNTGSYNWSLRLTSSGSIEFDITRVSNGSWWGGFSVPYTSSCPANSTLQGGQCVCNSGLTAQNGQCLPPADPCEATQGLTTGYTRLTVQFDNVNVTSSSLASFIGQNVTTGVPINGNNCAATGVVQDCGLFKSGTGGNTLVCGLTGSTYTGSTYNGEQTLFGLPQVDPNATPVDQLTKVCPEGQFPGEVNGSQVCVKANGSANTTQSTTTNPDGTSTTTTTTTACVGDKCTSTTTTETKDAQGNSTGTGTSKVEGDKDAFCMANPQAPECRNTKSNFGGTCTSSFTCESEDAVMCAIALDQYKTNCELLKRDENLGQNLASLIDMPLTDLDFDTMSIQAPQSPSSSCSITPFSISVGAGAFMVDLTHMCAYLSIIKAIVTAFGFVMWTLIVFVRQ